MKQKAIVVDLDWTLCELKKESEKHNHNGKEKPNYNMVEIFINEKFNDSRNNYPHMKKR